MSVGKAQACPDVACHLGSLRRGKSLRLAGKPTDRLGDVVDGGGQSPEVGEGSNRDSKTVEFVIDRIRLAWGGGVSQSATTSIVCCSVWLSSEACFFVMSWDRPVKGRSRQ